MSYPRLFQRCMHHLIEECSHHEGVHLQASSSSVTMNLNFVAQPLLAVLLAANPLLAVLVADQRHRQECLCRK
jgi:hypothetical protein